jgi:hypothetical protein
MEDYTTAQLLQEIKILESQKGICSESDRITKQQISLYQQIIDRIKEVI